MATAKTAMLTFRIEPGLKEALRTAAGQEHRSIANMVEVMIRDYRGRMALRLPNRSPCLAANGNPLQAANKNEQSVARQKELGEVRNGNEHVTNTATKLLTIIDKDY